MSSGVTGAEERKALRLEALSRLMGPNAPKDGRANASAALGVLYDLASSPSTAATALALLHELQVYQVELDLQDEELRRSRAEMEAALFRQVQLYDFTPAGCFTVDRSTSLRELNLTGARMLGFGRDALVGRGLDSFLVPQSARALNAMIARLSRGEAVETCTLQLAAHDGAPRVVRASAGLDPAGQHFLVVFLDAGVRADKPAV